MLKDVYKRQPDVVLNEDPKYNEIIEGLPEPGKMQAYKPSLIGKPYRPITVNYSKMCIRDRSHGVDINISGDVIRTKDLTWSLGANFSHYANEIVKIDDQVDENGKGDSCQECKKVAFSIRFFSIFKTTS